MERVDAPLAVALEWIEDHCVIPDFEDAGKPFLLSEEQLIFLANHYLVRASARRGQRATAFRYRRSQLVRAQKWGKSPLIAATVCLEGVGPALFDGWAAGGEVYDCRDYGCGCGWVYVYEPGEPMGHPWSTPLIQITATSEDQTDNTYGALRPMIELGPLQDVIPRTGEEFIRLPGGGRIDAVTSKANSRLGQRVTFAPQDETGLWVASNGGLKLASTQRRGLAGIGGRSMETTNAWDPSQNSVAQQTFESNAVDVYRDFRQPPPELDFHDERQRREILDFNYAMAPWVDVDGVMAEANEIMEKNPPEAERFFGNRIVAGQGSWMPQGAWERREDEREVLDGTRICLGFDGSAVDDWTAIRAETLDGHSFTPTYGSGRRTIWDPREWPGERVPTNEVLAAFLELFERFDVVRAYCDPPMWESIVDELQGSFPKQIFRWETYRPKQMHAALERFRADVLDPDQGFTQDGDVVAAAHIRNAVEIARRDGQTYGLAKASESQKIDVTMATVLAHEARMDAIAAGATAEQEEFFIYF
ncbi:hypothetical protein M3D15_04620 [Pseudoclavibacter alba]|uniref:Terminase n=1 Tax=Pseudoclavibacter albus TaxID=272241 RepID=A0ABT2HWC3_9MICO|nr:hypothetical protein [Pseudoclavibacter alba]MCT2042619.1 hypothetical protein [Pseudoclavibacter alba]